MRIRSTGQDVGIRIVLTIAAALALASCEEGMSGLGEAGPSASAASAGMTDTDAEAPEAFQVTDEGLWDGRPSLGGVWVAHPDVGEPERVIIRNESNGASVIGALFRRERENPGPEIQVSSEAAEALQMLAGAPARLNVTALRRVEPPAPAAPAAEADAAAPDGASTSPETQAATASLVPASEIGVTTLDPVAGAAAAIDAAEAAGVPGTPAAAAPAAAAATAPAPAAAPAPASGSGNLSRPYIQLGIFSVQANADKLAQDLQAKGLSTRVVAQQSQGRSFWRVLVGPATSEAQRQDLLAKVKAEGFADAYFVAN
jgi:rare lipoprotein A